MAVVEVLKMIIEKKELGVVCGVAENGEEALGDLDEASPDIILVDLLMPVMDGIAFVKAVKERRPDTCMIMLSQVTKKEIVSKAYEAGIEFYIQKPVNSVEISNVIARVERSRRMESTLSQLHSLVQTVTVREPQAQAAPDRREACMHRLNVVLQRLGISGASTSREICRIAYYLAEHENDDEQPNLSELCEMFSDNPKTLEQRIRRTINAGLTNLANLGIEDYGNDAFEEYAGTLYQFEQVRIEMNYIRGKTKNRGSVSVKRFLYALASLSKTTDRHIAI
jgi:two-component system response regulator YcbB